MLVMTSLLVACLVSGSSAGDVTSRTESGLSTWQPTSWLRDCSSKKGCGHLEASATRGLPGEQLTGCELRLKNARLEEENARLKQQAAAQESLNAAALEVSNLKLKHALEKILLIAEKQAAIDETSSQKRKVEELNNELEKVKSELQGEIATQEERVKAEFQGEITSQIERVLAQCKGDQETQSDRVKAELRVDSSTKFENLRHEIEECRNETRGLSETREVVSTSRSQLSSLATQLRDLKDKFELFMTRIHKIRDVKIPMVQLGLGNFYHFSTDKKNWTDAQTFCRSHGLELAAIETGQENALIMDHKMKTYGNKDVWLGGTDEGHEGRWVWSGTQRELTFTNWKSGEPGGGTSENCLCIGFGSDGPREWWDRVCGYEYNFICEASVPLFA